MNSRRYIIIGAVVIVLVVGVLGFVILHNSGSSGTSTGQTGTTGTLPQSGNQTGSGNGSTGTGNGQGNLGNGLTGVAAGSTPTATFGMISNEPVLAYFVTASNTVLTVQPTGKIETITGGQSSYLSSSEIANVLWAAFSYDGKKVLLSFGDRSAPQWSLFDVATKAWSIPSLNALTATWAPTSYQVAYFAPVNGVVALETLDVSNTKAKPRALISFPSEDFSLLWNSPTDILLSDMPSAYYSGSIFDFSLKTNTLNNVVRNKVGLEAQWNADASEAVLLAGTSLTRGGQIGIADKNGNLLHELSFLTLPSKCVFPVQPPPPKPVPTTPSKTKVAPKGATTTASSSASAATPTAATSTAFQVPGLICGIPRDTSKLAASPLPDIYTERTIMTADDFYTIDLGTGAVAPFFTNASQALDAEDLMFANKALFFINRYDQKLYAVTLSQ